MGKRCPNLGRSANFWQLWSNIDWDAIGMSMAELQVNLCRWVSKFMSGLFAHGKNMQ